MTELVDPTNDPGDLEGLEKDLQEAVTMEAPVEVEKSHIPEDNRIGDEPGYELPAKYKGKSHQDVIDMHKNLESAYGRMANDLGTQRKLTDRLLDLKRTDDLSQNSPEPLPEVSSSDLLDDPTKALGNYLDAREQRLAADTEARLSGIEATMQRESFMAKHSDYESVANSQEFAAWVQLSPLRVRSAQAAIDGDWQAADEILDEYKLAQNVAPPKADPLEEARQAGLTSSQASPDAASPSGKKTYRRADLIRLRLEKPEVYSDPGFQTEILAAYDEGRVK